MAASVLMHRLQASVATQPADAQRSLATGGSQLLPGCLVMSHEALHLHCHSHLQHLQWLSCCSPEGVEQLGTCSPFTASARLLPN